MANLVIEANRTCYAISQVHSTMTVGELIDLLSEYDSEDKVYLAHDHGYTFGGIHYDDFTHSESWEYPYAEEDEDEE